MVVVRRNPDGRQEKETDLITLAGREDREENRRPAPQAI